MPGRSKVNRRKDPSENTTRHTVSNTNIGDNGGEVDSGGETGSGTKTNGGGKGGEGGSGTKTNGGVNGGQGGNGKQPKAKETTRERKYSERIIKKKLAKRVKGKNGEGNTSGKTLDID